MILRLRKGFAPEDLNAVQALCAKLHYQSRFLDEERRLLEVCPERGLGGAPDRSLFEDLACVESFVSGNEAPELHLSIPGREETVVSAAGAVFGGGAVSLIAGPCAVEERGRLAEIARAVRASGAVLLRGGAYKPRSSPHSFQGLGEDGLTMLQEVRSEVGIGIVTEVLDPRDVERVGAVADIFQIGSRSMTNAPLLKEVGATKKPVLLKRGQAATLREFLLAAEYVLAGGNSEVILCERGVRGFDDVTRNLLDIGAVAYLKQKTHLPVIIDPSHAAGRRDLVTPLALAGLVAGADGLLVEVHPAPSEVHSDGRQALSLDAFTALAEQARAFINLGGRRLVEPDPAPVSV